MHQIGGYAQAYLENKKILELHERNLIDGNSIKQK